MTPLSDPPVRPLRALELWCDTFPSRSETFVLAEAQTLAALGHPLLVCAAARGEGGEAGDLPVVWLHEESTATRLRAMLAVAARHPLRCLRDLADRRRWRRQEDVPPLRTLAPAIVRLQRSGALVHAHFATGPALRALRVARVLGRPWTLTAHAYDIYGSPANLAEKLRSAALITSGCAYTVAELRRVADPACAERIHEIVMGVDPERFARWRPAPGGRHVVGVGRLVPKKGFVHLLHALADRSLAGARLTLVGDGPLRTALVEEADRLGLTGRVTFAGPLDSDGVRIVLEGADVLAMPSVIAPDGDRDSMPVAVKEAMAMQVPVIVSDVAGLPELVDATCGRVVAAGDAGALAGALAAVLDAGHEARAAMGQAGRARVIACAHLVAETTRLSALLTDVRPVGDEGGSTVTATPSPAPTH